MAENGSPILELNDVVIGYKGVPAVKGVSLSVHESSLTTILGPNGAGKSTVLRAVMGLVPCQSGEILFDGVNITKMPPHRIARSGLSLVPERRDLFPEMSVRENLEMGAYAQRDRKKSKEDLQTVLELFPALGKRLNQKAATLSGGEQQMVAIGRGLMTNPKVLLLDEPSLGLAPRLVGELFKKISLLHEAGTTVLLVEQNARLSLEIADYGLLLAEGKIAFEGPAASLRENEALERSYLGAI